MEYPNATVVKTDPASGIDGVPTLMPVEEAPVEAPVDAPVDAPVEEGVGGEYAKRLTASV